MCPFEPELGRGMVESLQLAPCPGRVARPAAGGGSVCARGLHARFKLPQVRILMASGARTLPLAERYGLGASLDIALPVAVGARNRLVRSGQEEPGRVMPREAEGRRLESGVGVTLLAAVPVRLTLKLPAVSIPMTCGTCEIPEAILDAVDARGMALHASHSGVTSLQWKSCGGVLGGFEGGRLESCDLVADRAISAIRACRKLAAVRILLVAIGTAIVRHGLLEISLAMTRGAEHAGMFVQEREFRLEMIEDGRNVRRFPACGRLMARSAGGAKGSPVRVFVAGRAVFVGDAPILDIRLGVLDPGMTLLAGCLFMRAREDEVRPIVIELTRMFPVGGVMAAGALP